MRKTIAYCGLDCGKCDAYRATVENDGALRKKTAKLWSELNKVTILPEQIACLGCRADGVKTAYCEKMCAIRRCAIGKGVETCGACADAETCRTLEAILSNNPEARKNLKTKE